MANKRYYDAIVVGAGSAGCLLTNRLVTAATSNGNTKVRVLLLEAGKPLKFPSNIYHQVPVGYYKMAGHEDFCWKYASQPQPELNGRTLAWPRGKILGGCSAINGLLWVRGQRSDYDFWATAAGDSNWNAENCTKRFPRIEEELKVGAPRCRMEDTCGATKQFLAASKELKVGSSQSSSSLFRGSFEGSSNDQNQEGGGMFPVTVTPEGLRSSAAKAFLKPALDAARGHDQLELLEGVMVDRILFEDPQSKRRATGISFIDAGGKKQTATLNRGGEVLLAAGAINSPQILMRSGIGNPADLMEHGIDVVTPLPGVGRNLHDHLQIRAKFRTNIPTLNDRVNSSAELAKMAAEYAMHRTGPLTMAPTPAVAFVRSDQTLERPDLQLHWGPWTSAGREVGPTSLFRTLDPWSAFQITSCQLRPKSRGTVKLQSDSVFDAPLINPNFLDQESDREVAARSVAVMRKFASTKCLSSIIDHGYHHKPEIQVEAAIADSNVMHPELGSSQEAALAYVRANAASIYHSVGTCAMGKKASDGSVVDGKLRVHGIEGLRVVDASIMPQITSGNTNAPVLCIAEIAAELFLSSRIN